MRRKERTAIKIARVIVRIVALFQIVAALAGVIAAGSAVMEHSPYVAVTVVYAILALANLVAGMSLLWLEEWSVLFSLVLQLVQIPILATESFPFYPIGLCLPITHHSIRHDGIEAHMIGVNLVAAVLFAVLLRFGNRAMTEIPIYRNPLVILPKRVASEAERNAGSEASASDNADDNAPEADVKAS